jgi:hypothetical protein
MTDVSKIFDASHIDHLRTVVDNDAFQSSFNRTQRVGCTPFRASLARSKNIHRLIGKHHIAQLHSRRLLFALHKSAVLAYININRTEIGDPAIQRTFV